MGGFSSHKYLYTRKVYFVETLVCKDKAHTIELGQAI